MLRGSSESVQWCVRRGAERWSAASLEDAKRTLAQQRRLYPKAKSWIESRIVSVGPWEAADVGD